MTALTSPGFRSVGFRDMGSPASFGPVPGAIAYYRFDEGRNLLKYSQQFDNAAWAKSRATITPNATLAPDNTQTADKLCYSGVTGGSYIYCTLAVVAETATMSVYAKAAECSQITLHFKGIGGDATLTVNLITGGIVSLTGAATPSIVAAPNGYYRISLSGIPSPTSGSWGYVDIINMVNIGDGAYIWGAQLEVGSTPSEYFPTTDKQTLIDCSGNGNHGTLGSTAGVDTNDPAWNAQGLVFGGDDKINISQVIQKLQGLSCFTLQFVAYSSVDKVYGGIISPAVSGFTSRSILNILNNTDGGAAADMIYIAIAQSSGVYSSVNLPGKLSSTPELITIRYQGGTVLEARRNQSSWARNTTGIVSNLNPAVYVPELYLGCFAGANYLTGGVDYLYLHPGYLSDEQLAGNYAYIKSELRKREVILP